MRSRESCDLLRAEGWRRLELNWSDLLLSTGEDVAMVDTERKSLVWSIRKSLLSLSSNKLFQIAENVGPVPGKNLSSQVEMQRSVLNTSMPSSTVRTS